MKSRIIMGLSITAILLIFVVGIPIIQSRAATTPTTSASTWTGNFDGFSQSSTNWGLDSSLGGSWGWADMSPVADATTPDKHQALKVHYQWGSSSNSCTDCNGAVGGGQFYTLFSKTQAPALAQATTLYMQYYVKFPTGFDFGKAGKLPGLYGGSNKNVSGGNHSTTAFSARHMWRITNGQPDGETYAYLLNSPAYGTDLGLGKWSFSADNKWHSIQQEVQLPTGGQANGVITDWYDDKLVNTATNQAIPPNIPFSGIFFSTFFGGHATAWGPVKPAGATADGEDAFFSAFTVSTQKITSSTTGGVVSPPGATALTADDVYTEESTAIGGYTLSTAGKAELTRIAGLVTATDTSARDTALDGVVTDIISGTTTPTSTYTNLEADLKAQQTDLTAKLLAWVNLKAAPTPAVADLKTAMGTQTFSAYVLSLPPATTSGGTALTADDVYTEESTVIGGYTLSALGKTDLTTIAAITTPATRDAALDGVVTDIISGTATPTSTYTNLEADVNAQQADLTTQLLAWVNLKAAPTPAVTDLKTAMGTQTFSAYVLSLPPATTGGTALTADDVYTEESTVIGGYTLSTAGTADLARITAMVSTTTPPDNTARDTALDGVVTDIISGTTASATTYPGLEADLQAKQTDLTTQLLAWVNLKAAPTPAVADLKTSMGTQTFSAYVLSLTPAANPTGNPTGGTALTAVDVYNEESTVIGGYTLSTAGKADLARITALTTPATQETALDGVVTDIISGTTTSTYTKLEADLQAKKADLNTQLLAWVNLKATPTPAVTNLKTAMGTQTFSAYVLGLTPATTGGKPATTTGKKPGKDKDPDKKSGKGSGEDPDK